MEKFKLLFLTLSTIAFSFLAIVPAHAQEEPADPLGQQPGTPPPAITPATPLPGTPVITGTIAPTTALEITATLVVTETLVPETDLTETPTITSTLVTETPTRRPPIVDVRPEEVARTLATRLVISGFVLAVTWGAALLLRKVVSGLLIRLHPDVQVFVARVIFILVWVIGILVILNVFEVEVATITAIIGTLGLALSLSSQELFKNFIAGIYLLIERPFVVGDYITVGDHTGRVEFVDLRTTILRTDDGREVILPNTIMMSQAVIRRANGFEPVEPDEPEELEEPEGPQA